MKCDTCKYLKNNIREHFYHYYDCAKGFWIGNPIPDYSTGLTEGKNREKCKEFMRDDIKCDTCRNIGYNGYAFRYCTSGFWTASPLPTEKDAIKFGEHRENCPDYLADDYREVKP